MNDLKKHIIIKCPKCGYEYLASEIFYPDDLLGGSTDILRDENGKIIFLGNGKEPSLETEGDEYLLQVKIEDALLK